MPTVAALLALVLAAQPGDFEREEQNALLHFRYAWPEEAEAVPRLRARLRRDMAAAQRWAVARATETRRSMRRGGLDYALQDYEQAWEMAGQTPQLLSLTSVTFALSGGAHGNISASALLWDLAADRPAAAAAAFGPALAGMAGRFCAELDRQRAVQRGGPVPRQSDDPFDRCPRLAEETVAPADEDGNGRFETLRVVLPAERAGPYIEGDYVIDIAFTAADLAPVPARYRPAFEAAGEE